MLHFCISFQRFFHIFPFFSELFAKRAKQLLDSSNGHSCRFLLSYGWAKMWSYFILYDRAAGISEH